MATASSLTSAVSDVENDKKELDDLIRQSASGISSVKSEYESSVQAQLNSLLSSVSDTRSDISGLMTQLDNSMDGIYTLADSASSDLSEIQTTLDDSCKLLTKASEKLEKTTGKLSSMAGKRGFFSTGISDCRGYGQYQFVPLRTRFSENYRSLPD